jgi:small subunit ribosomal protein S17
MITKKGIVTSAKMTGTITVIVHRQVNHPLYKKSFRRSKKFMADLNKIEDVVVGDEVLIEECRPLSKNKHFILKEVLKRVPRVAKMKEEKGLEEAMHGKATPETASESTVSTPK